MAKPIILEEKFFTVGRRKVLVRRQDAPGDTKPCQVFIKATVKGITKKQTSSYDAGSANRDFEYKEFDQAKAEKYVASVEKFLNTVKGKGLLDA